MEQSLGRDSFRLQGLLKGRPLIGPRSVNIHIVNACDRRCNFCWYFSPLVSHRDKRRELSYGVLERVLRDCVEIGVEEIDLEGGEVVLHSRVADVFRLVHRLGMKIAAYTHLAYGREHLDYLWRAHRLIVNLSAATAGSYEKVHGSDRFNDVLANLRLLSQIRKEKGSPNLVLTFIIHKDNYKDLPGILAIAEKIPVDQVLFRLFKATGEMKRLMFSGRSADDLRRVVHEAMRKKYKVSNNLSEMSRVLENGSWFKNFVALGWNERHNDRIFYYNNLSGSTPRCYAGWFYAYIDERGRVVAPCDNVGICIAGNVNKQSFKDIWFNSEKLNRIRRAALRGIDPAVKRWFECRYCGHVGFNREIDDLLTRNDKRVHEKKDP